MAWSPSRHVAPRYSSSMRDNFEACRKFIIEQQAQFPADVRLLKKR